jgi:hypothetical protein
MKCIIRVRHQNDDSSGQISYEELGMVELSFHQMLSAGMTLTNQTTRPLKKCSSMKRVDGFLKLSVSIVTNTATANESLSSSSDPTPLAILLILKSSWHCKRNLVSLVRMD